MANQPHDPKLDTHEIQKDQVAPETAKVVRRKTRPAGLRHNDAMFSRMASLTKRLAFRMAIFPRIVLKNAVCASV